MRSYENGAAPDVTGTVYLKNFYVGGTPQQAYSLGIDYAAPGMWFFNLNANWMGDSYVDLAPIRHEAMPDLWQAVETQDELDAKIKEITTQEKLKNAFVVNASVGKVIYTRWGSININVSVNNLLNNRNIMTGGHQIIGLWANAAYQGQTFSFGQGYVIPKPFDPRLIEWLPPAVAQAAMDTGVARKPIEDMDVYKASLRVRIQKAQGRANALIESYK